MDFLGLPRRDKPCERCGWRYLGFHVCFDASKPCPGEGILNPVKNKKTRAAKASETMTARWEEHREHFRERDAEIVVEYKDGMGLRDIAEKHKMSHTTVIKVIRRAEADSGETIMRPRGHNLRWTSQKEVNGGFQ